MTVIRLDDFDLWQIQLDESQLICLIIHEYKTIQRQIQLTGQIADVVRFILPIHLLPDDVTPFQRHIGMRLPNLLKNAVLIFATQT